MVPRKTWVSENFGQILKSRKRFSCVSKSRFLMIFASRSLESFYRGVSKSQICRLSFPFGLKESSFSEFMGTAYRTEQADHQDSLPLAFWVIFLSFICTIISKFSALSVSGSDF